MQLEKWRKEREKGVKGGTDEERQALMKLWVSS